MSLTWTAPGGPPPRNGCRRCGRDFSSLAAFDAHFTGDRNVTFRPSAPETHHGFRCLDLDDEPNWVQNARGRWTTEKLAAKGQQLAAHHARHGLSEPE